MPLKNNRLEKQNEQEVEKIIKYKFKDKSLLFNVFCHSSYANSFSLKSNERLEFLGDTVLGFIISDKIYFDKEYEEGGLSKLRSKIVSEGPLSDLCDKLGLYKYMLIGNGSGKIQPTVSMKADLIEALIGAIYIDAGLKQAKNFVISQFSEIIKSSEGLEVLEDSKSLLQEKFYDAKIRYMAKKYGSEHNPIFKVVVYVNDVACGRGEAGTKRSAEQLAAREALKVLTKV